MPARPSTAVLGFRPHTYWTAVVALAGSAEAPQILERRRIEFAAGAERFVAAVRKATEANATREVGTLIGDLQRDGVAVRSAVVSAGTATFPASLEEILKSHAYMHAAEGTFYRDVVAKACADLGLTVHRIAERDMPARAGEQAHVDHSTLDELLKQMGSALGPPWSEDYRLATQAAWAELG